MVWTKLLLWDSQNKLTRCADGSDSFGYFTTENFSFNLENLPTVKSRGWASNARFANQRVWTPMGMASVSSLEDIIGGHLWIGVILLGGGAWHILITPKAWVVKILWIEADAILSYSLGGLAFMALVSCAFVGFNTTAFPVEFYGIDRSSAAGSQFFLALIALVGHLWHAYRARMVGVAA